MRLASVLGAVLLMMALGCGDNGGCGRLSDTGRVIRWAVLERCRMTMSGVVLVGRGCESAK